MALVYLTSPVVTSSDSRLSVPTAASILLGGDLDLDEFPEVRERGNAYDVVRRDDHLYPLFPYGPALFALPAVAVVEAGRLVGVGDGTAGLVETDRVWVVELVVAAMVVAATTAVLASVAAELLAGEGERRRRLGAVVALGFAFATPAWSTASRALWQHGPSMLLVSVALLLAVRSSSRPERAAWMGPVLVAAYAVRPTNAVPLVLLGGWALLCRPPARLRFLVWAAAVAVPFVVVNLASYGGVLPPYFAAQRLGDTSDLGEALAGHLVSPSRGLLVFSPVLVLAIAGVVVQVRRRRADLLFVAVALAAVGHWVVVAHQWGEGQGGGSAYGPRLMTDLVPLLVFLALPAVDALPSRWSSAGGADRLALVGVALLLAVSVVNHAQGAYLRAAYCWSAEPVHVDVAPERVWSWSDPQFTRGWRRLFAGDDSLRQVVVGRCRGGADDPG